MGASTTLFEQVSSDGNNWVTFNTNTASVSGETLQQAIAVSNSPVLSSLQQMNVFIRIVSDLTHVSNVIEVSL